jgi:High potential iron-sulfur protein
MSESMSRRDALLRLALLAGATGSLCAQQRALAADQPHLTTADPTAVALAYHESASSVDAKQFPTYKAGQTCSTCLQLKGDAGQAWRPCNLFPGKLVNANGWCRVWVKRP